MGGGEGEGGDVVGGDVGVGGFGGAPLIVVVVVVGRRVEVGEESVLRGWGAAVVPGLVGRLVLFSRGFGGGGGGGGDGG